MRVIMTGGGTGGHIYPAIAIADTIKKKRPDAEILFVGTEKGMEKDIVPKNGYPLQFITVSGFNRKNLVKNVKTATDLMKGNHQAKKIIKRFQPDVVIGTGGYVCGPVVRAANKMGVRTFIHEQNAYPGVTNKLLERYVERVFISFADSKAYFKDHDKLVVTGNPIRRSFLNGTGTNEREKLGINADEFVLLCFGGSRGAGIINNTMVEVIEKMYQLPDIKLFFVTGKIYYEKIKTELKKKGIPLSGRINILEYVDNMHEYIFAADLIVSRSGALTVSEITACGKASILIPSPNVTANHQFFNAKVVADRGGAVIIEEKDLNEDILFTQIEKLRNDRDALQAMSAASKAVGRVDAADIIYDHLNI